MTYTSTIVRDLWRGMIQVVSAMGHILQCTEGGPK